MSEAGLTEMSANLPHLLTVQHHYATARICKQNDMPEYAAKLMITLIRYAHLIPCDKAFFDAGSAALEMEWYLPPALSATP